MRHRRRFPIALCCWVAVSAQEPTFQAGVKVVNVLASVRDRQGAYVRDLAAEDFTLTEDGRPQRIAYFARETDLPLTLGLLVDTSLSQERVMDAERGASLRFFDRVLREKKDHVFVMQFDSGVFLRQPLTSSRRDLDESLALVDTPSRRELRMQGSAGTRLYDAVVKACGDVMRGQRDRKALILLTDGLDIGSDASLAEASDAAQRADTLVYSILFAGENGAGRGPLERLARATGGAFFEVSRKLPIDRVFELIQEDLRSQYSLGYVSDRPARGLELRRIAVQVRRAGLRVQAREKYWARP